MDTDRNWRKMHGHLGVHGMAISRDTNEPSEVWGHCAAHTAIVIASNGQHQRNVQEVACENAPRWKKVGHDSKGRANYIGKCRALNTGTARQHSHPARLGDMLSS